MRTRFTFNPAVFVVCVLGVALLAQLLPLWAAFLVVLVLSAKIRVS